MRLTWALLVLEGVSAVDVYAAVAARQCTGSVGCQGYYRAFSVMTNPFNSAFDPTSNVTGVSVAAIGAQASTAGTVTQAKVDVGGLKFKTPADTSDSNNALSFYFGYLGATGTWDSTTKTGSMAGALAEVASSLSSINVWYDNDGVTGFNWDVTQPDITKRWNVYDCAQGVVNSYDCLDPNGSIDLKTLIWTPISHTKVVCNTIPALSTAPAGCEIHSLTTSGALASIPGTPVITFTARIASQPVLINNIPHGPDFTKFDVTVAFPWSQFNLYSNTTAKVALIAFTAGKSGTFAAATTGSDGSNSLTFAAGSASSHYSYTANAQVDGVSEPVTTQVITGQQILDFTCPAGSPCAGLFSATSWISAILKIGVNWWQAFGWKVSVTIHALGTSNMPTTIFWDPQVGADGGANSAAFAVPSLILLAALMLH